MIKPLNSITSLLKTEKSKQKKLAKAESSAKIQEQIDALASLPLDIQKLNYKAAWDAFLSQEALEKFGKTDPHYAKRQEIVRRIMQLIRLSGNDPYEALSQGGRINFQSDPEDMKVLFELLIPGGVNNPVLEKRRAASHSVTKDKDGNYKEVRLKGGVEALFDIGHYSGNAISGTHFGIDVGVQAVPMNGLAQAASADGTHGHLYLFVKDGSLMIGVEGSAPGKANQFGQKHGPSAKNNPLSATGSSKAGYTLKLLTMENEPDLKLLEKQNITSPVLIKQGNAFYIFGEGRKGNKKLNKLDVNEELENLDFKKNAEIKVSNKENIAIFNEIKSKNGHAGLRHFIKLDRALINEIGSSSILENSFAINEQMINATSQKTKEAAIQQQIKLLNNGVEIPMETHGELSSSSVTPEIKSTPVLYHTKFKETETNVFSVYEKTKINDELKIYYDKKIMHQLTQTQYDDWAKIEVERFVKLSSCRSITISGELPEKFVMAVENYCRQNNYICDNQAIFAVPERPIMQAPSLENELHDMINRLLQMCDSLIKRDDVDTARLQKIYLDLKKIQIDLQANPAQVAKYKKEIDIVVADFKDTVQFLQNVRHKELQQNKNAVSYDRVIDSVDTIMSEMGSYYYEKNTNLKKNKMIIENLNAATLMLHNQNLSPEDRIKNTMTALSELASSGVFKEKTFLKGADMFLKKFKEAKDICKNAGIHWHDEDTRGYSK